jgi:outer membrane protein assembly factor BamE (lipoprotein component of BamABCDE complex)
MAGLGRIGAVLAAASLAAGCTPIVGHRGYLNDEFLVQSVQPGVDNRQSVERALGHPTLESQFGEPVWYYIGSTTAQKPFTTPRITDHSVLAVRFDGAGNVSDVQRTGIEQLARLRPESDKTPTLGRERGFLEVLIGNIGQVGAAGMGGGNPGP